jgi:phosphatidylinositol 4-kinase
MGGISALVELMLDTQLPCFKPGTMENLVARFFPGGTVSAAAKSMSGVMAYAFSARGTFFTHFYDKFQEFDNGIAM